MDFSVDYVIHELPSQGANLKTVYKALVNNLSGSTDEILTLDRFSPRFTGDSWSVWNEGEYKPLVIQSGRTVLDSKATAYRLQRLQPKNGVIATTDDVYKVKDVITLQEGFVGVDWSMGKRFRIVLSGNRQSSIYLSNSNPGMIIEVLVVNSGTNQTVGFWDTTIKWPGSTPAVPAAKPGASNSMLATLRNVGGVIYGESVSYSHDPIPAVDIAKALPTLA